MNIENFNIEDVIVELKKEKRIFCSEADFQHTLAWTIKKKYKSKIKKIYLEYPFIKLQEEHNHLDILIILNDNKIIPIELKYKTTYPGANKDKKGKLYNNYKEKIKFKVRNQGAKNYGCYNYIKDISRIEMFKDDKMFKDNFKEGYAIFLTNDSSYWKKGNSKSDYYNFSIYHKRHIEKDETLTWKYPEKHNLYPEIKIKGTYDFYWNPYYKKCKEYKSKENFGEFKYLITTIKQTLYDQ